MRNSLYQDTEYYTFHKFKSEKEWIKGRTKTIGGSSASALIDMNPWKDNNQLWKEFFGIEEPKDISKKPQVIYGKKAEKHLRELFALDFTDKYEVQYVHNCFLRSREIPWMIYSPDGLLIDKETGRKGILEIKTTEILQSMQREKWDDRVPNNYYIQVLHGLNTTNFDFVVLKAQLKTVWKQEDGTEKIILTTKHYYFDREDENVKVDLEWLKEKEIEVYNKYYATQIEPSINLSNFLRS